MPDKVGPKMSAPRVRGMKAKGEKVVCITAYDLFSGSIADAAGADVVLVGDSLGNVILGYRTTVPVNLDQMIHHTAAARSGVERALLVADLSFGSYQSSVSQAVDSAVALMKAGAEAVKLEGVYLNEIRAIVKAGIPVMGHIGMTPQSIHRFGGFKVQGKGEEVNRLIEEARQLEDAGVFSMVLELIPADAAKAVTESVSCPTIGIGAGPHCDGQVQVFHDVLGLFEDRMRHAKRYVEGRELFLQALKDYVTEVRDASFPTGEHSV